jgi:hypothetical protein
MENPMSWLTSVVERVKDTSNNLLAGARWLLDKTPLSRFTAPLYAYAAETTAYVIDEGKTVYKENFALINKPETRKFASGVQSIILYDVVPILTMNYINNYFQPDSEDDKLQVNSFISLSLLSLSLSNYYISSRLGSRGLARVAVLDTFGPAAFNSHKTTPPPSPCDVLECNNLRKMKGQGREQYVLLMNGITINLISYIPHLGWLVAPGLSVINNGRYITRLVTPERCDHHKNMKSEFVLAVGLTYEATSRTMEYLLIKAIGAPAYLTLVVLRHILLSMHVNVAAHMNIPLVPQKRADQEDSGLTFNIFDLYESAHGWIFEVILAGLGKVLFRPKQGNKQLIDTLQFLTARLNSDMEYSSNAFPYKQLNWLRQKALPPIFHSGKDFLNDPVVSAYWPSLKEEMLSSVTWLEAKSDEPLVTTLAALPKVTAFALNFVWGIPQKPTQFLLMLSQKQEFKNLMVAFKQWLERHGSDGKRIVPESFPTLRGARVLEPLTLKAPVSEVRVEALASRADRKEVKVDRAIRGERTINPNRFHSRTVIAQPVLKSDFSPRF